MYNNGGMNSMGKKGDGKELRRSSHEEYNHYVI